MSSYSTFVRALSPGAPSVVTTDDTLLTTRRQHAILACNSVLEIVSIIPSDYRSICADYLTRLAATAERYAKTRATLASWKHHLSVGTLPASLRSAATQVQFTAGYGDSADAKSAQKAINDAHLEYQKATLSKLVAARAKEEESLKAEIAPETACVAMHVAVKAASATIVTRYRIPVEHAAGAADGPDVGMGHITWEQSPAALAIRDEVLADCPVYAQRVVSITLTRAELSDRKIEKKCSIATAATAAASDDAGPPPPGGGTLSDAVKAEVKRFVMGLMPREPKSKKKDKVQKTRVSADKSRYGIIADFFQGSSRISPSQDYRPLRGHQEVFNSSLVPTHTHRTRTQERQTRAEGRGEWWGEQTPTEAEGSRGLGQGRGTAAATEEVEREEEEIDVDIRVEKDGMTDLLLPNVVERVASLVKLHARRPNPSLIALGELWISQPKTMPDFLLSLPLPVTVNIVLSNCSLRYLEELKFQQYVHLSPDVTLPRDIAFNLSLGAKYMFHQPTNENLIDEAWKDFNRRLRWRLFFLYEGGDNNEPYDPDYDVRAPSKKQAPPLPQYIELGLIAGRRYANKAFVKARDSKSDQEQFVYTPQVKAVREFLTTNKYVVTGTDKNLGIAVSKSEWIIQKCQDCLDSVNDYRRLMPHEASNILSLKCKQMLDLSRRANDNYALGKQLADFLRSRVTVKKAIHHIPVFYGIPKIHKVPTKMRPIIPCHSAIMNPAAKVVSKRLKPIVESAPTIIHGTKDLAIKLSKLNIDQSRKWYIVTGDVVAFYPNIPLEQCLNIVKEMHFDHYFSGERFPYSSHNTELQTFFSLCCDIGNTQLITQFNGQIYEQLNGLAMGVADSPDLTNLFGYYFERRSRVLDHPNIFYYGRYIDDCLAIVYAESNLEAINLLQSLIKFDNCVIEWSPASSSQPFLDMLLYKNNKGELHYMPYRKAGNHQERIPWISAHPLDVKRGTFLGEMSRLAVLSSTMETYLEALKGLISLYIHRGYPAELVHKWYYSNIQVRWSKKLENRPEPTADTLVLKTEYNLAWNYFNAHELGQTIIDYWGTWLQMHDAGTHNIDYPAPPNTKGVQEETWDLRETNIFNSRVILSRKRTRNFLDLTNLWKKSVLEKIERDVLGEIANSVRVAVARPTNSLDYDINTAVTGPRSIQRSGAALLYDSDSDGDEPGTSRSRSPRTSDAWRSGATNQWGRGARP
jgi:hypothetical protein